MPQPPSLDAAAPTAPAGPISKEPWLKWPPDRKVWAGGVAGLATWLLLGLFRKYTGLDLQLLVDGLNPLFDAVGIPHISIAATLTGAITLAVAHYTAPSVRDVVNRVNNLVVKMANADPENPTTATVVNPIAADDAAKRDIAIGVIPAEIVAKREPTENL